MIKQCLIFYVAPVDKVTQSDANRAGTKILFVASLFPVMPDLVMPSPIQHALYCDIGSIRRCIHIFDNLKAVYNEDRYAQFLQTYITGARADGNRNILHVAVMNAFSKTNTQQADTDGPLELLKSKLFILNC